MYGSIGYAAGAAAGACVAAKESGRFERVVLVTGEGSLQLTVQALSLLSRVGVEVVVFVLNNNGYVFFFFFFFLLTRYSTSMFQSWGRGD